MHIERSVEPGHHEVTFTWRENDPDRPAHAVLVRLVAVTDYAQDDGDLSCYLMQPDHDDLWKLTRRLPSTLRSSYQICPIRDEPVHGHPSEERWMQILGMGVCDPQNPAILAAGTTYGNPGRRSWPRFAVVHLQRVGYAGDVGVLAARNQVCRSRRRGQQRGQDDGAGGHPSRVRQGFVQDGP